MTVRPPRKPLPLMKHKGCRDCEKVECKHNDKVCTKEVSERTARMKFGCNTSLHHNFGYGMGEPNK